MARAILKPNRFSSRYQTDSHLVINTSPQKHSATSDVMKFLIPTIGRKKSEAESREKFSKFISIERRQHKQFFRNGGAEDVLKNSSRAPTEALDT